MVFTKIHGYQNETRFEYYAGISVVFASIFRTPVSYAIIASGTVVVMLAIFAKNRRSVIETPLLICLTYITFLLIFTTISYTQTSDVSPMDNIFAVRLAIFYPYIFIIIIFYSSSYVYRIMNDGIFYALLGVCFVAILEIALNIDMITLTGRSERSVVAGELLNDRFLATSIYLNYNDLMFAVSIYIPVILGCLFSIKGHKLFYILFSLLLFIYQIYVGSRSAIVSSILVFMIFIYIYIRMSINSIYTSRILLLFYFSAIIVSFIFLFNYSGFDDFYVDNSSIERFRIYSDALEATFSVDNKYIIGLGSKDEYYHRMSGLCGYDCLTSPHNFIIEMLYNFGVVNLVVFCFFYVFVLFRVIFLKFDRRYFGLSVAFLSLPISGLAPSSSLDFYFHWWLIIATVSGVWSYRDCARDTRVERLFKQKER